MSLLSLFTSSSERPLTRGRAVLLGLCTVAGLAAIDAAVNFAFAYPDDPKVTQVDQVAAYFEYGRSIEGKLARITRSDPAQTAPITLAGWYQPLTAKMIGGAKACAGRYLLRHVALSPFSGGARPHDQAI